MIEAIAAQIFHYGVIVTGCFVLLSLMLYSLGLSAVQVFKWFKVWHVICLALSVRLHGKHFADEQFWWAIKERASKSRFSANQIAQYANAHAPKEGGEE